MKRYGIRLRNLEDFNSVFLFCIFLAHILILFVVKVLANNMFSS